ncbi:dienelactone hydrolase family protein [Microbacterium pseudoresistens]|uniref:Phospholipase/carboxylesterase n=1 Tax=Microbacterium pseudoresistens TaxID=640634 RepID=A0A7Y9JLF4_9MICO|nr:phospholipase/carboxylesterase [Microbacterium pseudoresistens]
MSEQPVIDRTAVRWGPRREGAPLLVLLHGYGSDENDLFGLVPFLPDPFTVASLPAPLTAPWPMPGRSWYVIDELERRDPEPVTAAARAVLDWLDDDARDAPRILLLGFSQGASVALQTLRLAPERIDAVVNLAGYAAPGDLPRDPELREARPPVFWGRGTKDDVIPHALVDHTAQWLPDHAELSGRVYPGLTHSVSEEELADVRAFLERRLAEPVEDADGQVGGAPGV